MYGRIPNICPKGFSSAEPENSKSLKDHLSDPSKYFKDEYLYALNLVHELILIP